MDTNLSKPIIDSIIRSKRKSIALVVTSDAKLIVRAPYRASLKYIEELVLSKNRWILEKQQSARLRYQAHTVKRVADGEEFLFLGKTYRLETKTGKAVVELQPGRLVLQGASEKEKEAVLSNWYKKQAKRIFTERTTIYSNLTGLYPKSVSISGARKRWGSCGPKNTLNFSWRLVMAPLKVIDYVVVHELAHIEFKNHSREFWDRVAKILPEYKDCRKWLVQNQKLLELL